MAKKKLDERIQRLLCTIADDCDKEDLSVRERQIRTWKQLKLLWEGYSRIWYSEVAHDWRIADTPETDDTQQSYYDKPVNVFRAYLESIIAALSVTVPNIKCFPDDADNTLDLSTAKAGDKIAQLVARHNNVQLLWLHALFIFATEGMVACYTYPKSDEKYGTYKNEKYEDSAEQHEVTKCPNCQFEFDSNPVDPSSQTQGQEVDPQQIQQQQQQQVLNDRIELSEDEFQPDDSNVDVQNVAQEPEICPNCAQAVIPQITQETIIVTKLVGVTNEPKSRICMEAYGGLNVKISNYAKTQAECSYLKFSHEVDYAQAIERYEDLHGDESIKDRVVKASGPDDNYEFWGRLSPQYRGEYPTNVVTINQYWLRPAKFNILPDLDEVKELKKLFPNGCKLVRVNQQFAEACNESLDDTWTLTYNPLADFVHYDPLGMLLISIQEITNDLISLVIQTIEHGIPQTFADPGVLDFPAYRQLEAVPGGIYEVTPKSGKSVADAFYEVRTATLSAEVLPFSEQVQSLGQLASGALPSLFGGQIEGSDTASEYSMSRAQALQRQQNTWKILLSWWKEINGKVIPMFIKELKDDEKDVQRAKDGSFFNVFIRKAELEGKIGKVEIEANENIPATWAQQKDMLMKFIEAGNPQILEIIGDPENMPVLREALGLVDFFIPGEDARNKQYDEIKLLLNSEPIPTGDMMNPEMPSVEVDQIYDKHPIEFDIVQKWANSDAGRQAKTDNPPGYMNVLLHGKMHYMFMQQAMAMQAGAAPGAKPNEQNQEAPIVGEGNVETVQ
jgi:hypothetical protein